MYQYKQSGLDNVWLVNGFEVISTPYGNAVKFENANELDGAIAKALLHKNEVMNGKEFRFLRQQIGMSQNDVARFMQLDVQTIARWEKEQVALPFANDAILRFLYSSYEEKDAQILPMIETMKIIDKCTNSKLFLSFDTKKTHWDTTEDCSA